MPLTEQMIAQLHPPHAPEASWLAIASMLADVAFETDCQGVFTAFGPGKVLDYPPARLLGTPANAMLFPSFNPAVDSPAAGDAIIAAICQECVGWQGQVKIASAMGGEHTYRLSMAPRITADGKVIGTYGLLFRLDTVDPDLSENQYGAGRTNAMLDDDTGFWSAKTFAYEASRRFDRLDVEGQPGTLLALGFSRAPSQLHSPIAMRIAEELRDVVRPTDLLGRINATTIALWYDGMDHLTGGERAARFCRQLPGLLPDNSLITAGLATRWPGSSDDAQTVIERAGIALRLADLASERETDPAATGAWRVWQDD
jgi:hypothetical protein